MMKAKILLLSLATLLLGACQSENEPTETFIYYINPRAWKKETSL